MQPFDVRTIPNDRRALVEASAGTGKTYAITTLVLRLLLERGLTIDQILVVTFTEAAAAELKQRVRDRLREAAMACEDPSLKSDLRPLLDSSPSLDAARLRIRQALLSFDDAGIFTIHGFCHRVLKENAFFANTPFDAELLKDTRPLVAQLLLDFWARELTDAPLSFVRHLGHRNLGPSTLASFAHWVARANDIHLLPTEADAKAASQPAVDDHRIQAAFDAAKQQFDPPTVMGQLNESRLNGNTYRKKSFPNWREVLSHFFAQDSIGTELPDFLPKLTPPALAAGRTSKTLFVPDHAFFDQCQRLLEVVAQAEEELDQQVLRFKQRLVRSLQRDLPRHKTLAGVISFDDLLDHLAQALRGPSGRFLAAAIARRYPVALIDEFQDTDPTQYAIFDRIYSGTNSPLFMIGDPKQAIYSFRGADVFAYLKAVQAVPAEQRHTMATNYRSAPQLVEAVGLLFRRSPLPFYLQDITYPPVRARDDAVQRLQFAASSASEGGAQGRAPLQFRFLRKRDARHPGHDLSHDFKSRVLPRLVAAEVARLLTCGATIDGRPLAPKDIAILTRTNAEAFSCQHALQELRIAGVVLGDRSVYQYDEAKDLQLLLSAILEPNNTRVMRSSLVTELLGLSANELVLLDADEARWEQWAEHFRQWHQRWLDEGFVQMIRQVIADCRIAERLLVMVDGERRMTNLLHLVELLHTAATSSHLGPSGVLQYLREQRQREYAVAEDEQIRLESDDDAVVLTTIHKSKGLEYPIVICPTLHNGMLLHSADKLTVRFHDREASDELTLDLGSEQLEGHIERMREEAMAENLRLLYVALTRAKYRCVIFWGAFREFEKSALAYLLHSDRFTTLSRGNASTPPPLAELDRLRKLTNDEQLATLKDLDPSGEYIQVSEPDVDDAPPVYDKPNRERPKLEARTAKPRLTSDWKWTASFSALAAHQSPAQFEVPADPLDGKDYDAETGLAEESNPESGQLVTLHDFPGGARTGNFFHSLLEHCDFQGGDHAELIRDKLREYGFDAALETTVAAALPQILKTQFADGLSLKKITRSERLDELEFYMPAGGSGHSGRLSARGVAQIFRNHPSDAVAERYVERLERLRFTPLNGFLKGFIDLTFRHDGGWYVVDYKTNTLGTRYDDYQPNKLSSCMIDSHYVLQYHLYILAVHRYLTTRIKDYDYERDFRGAYYLFIRGMLPKHRAQCGVFFEKPPLGRIEALSELLGGQVRRSAKVT